MNHLLLSILVFCGFLQIGYSSNENAKSVPGEMLVRVGAVKLNEITKNFEKLDYEIIKTLNLSVGKFYLIKQKSGKHNSNFKADIKTVEQINGVVYAEPNFVYKINSVSGYLPNDPKFGQLWGLRNNGRNDPRDSSKVNKEGRAGADIAALKAWEVTKGDKRVKIAVIDTGIDYNHEDLKDNIWINEAEANGKEGVDDDNNGFIDDIRGWNFHDDTNDPMDGHGHGTHCSGTIGAKHNDIGVAGIMDEVSLLPVKFLGDDGSGSTEGAISAIDYAIKMNVDIMSNSWGGGAYSKALEDVIKEANEKGIIFVAAAGNSAENNDNGNHYPSNYPVENVIAVAAHDFTDNLASFSNYGKTKVLIAAPGKNILSTVTGNDYAIMSGTSMAAPHVSGSLGLLLAKEGRLPMVEVRERLEATAVKVNSMRSKVKARGRLNAYNLVTDTRPYNPNPTNWVDYDLPEVFESQHPYANGLNISKTFQIPGARFIRVVVKKFELENKFDLLKVVNTTSREEGDVITGSGENYVTEFVEGDTIELNFSSDNSVTKWGFRIEKLQYATDTY